MSEVEYGASCGFVRLCDRPRGHDGDHGAWGETTAEQIRRSSDSALRAAARLVIDEARKSIPANERTVNLSPGLAALWKALDESRPLGPAEEAKG